MASISELRNRLKTFSVTDAAEQAIDDNRNNIVKAQGNQLKRGKRKDGSIIGKYRSKKYAAIKATMNPLAGFGNVDLILTGAFKNDIFIDVRQGSFIIDSADSKTAELFDKYGDPLGLGYDARVEVIDNGLRNSFINNVKKQIGL